MATRLPSGDGDGLDSAALFAPRPPAQRLRFRVEPFLAVRPDANDLIVSSSEQKFAIGRKEQGIRGADATAGLDDDLGLVPRPAIGLLSLGR